MTLHRHIALAIAAALIVTSSISTATAQRGGRFDLNRPTVPLDSGCWTNDACGNYSSYGRGA